MKIAEIKGYSKDPKNGVLLATVTFDGEHMNISGPRASDYKDRWEKTGIIGPAGERVYPKDGEVFFKSLASHFQGFRVGANFREE